jgi:hypothetical protein
VKPLTILCVTEHGPHSPPFITDMEEIAEQLDAAFVLYDGRGAECLENVLDQAVASCPDGMILRLDDDERCAPEMRDWLEDLAWAEHDHWAFPRYNLYPDESSYITSLNLYPDLQTRLSTKEKSGGRNVIHCGSPYGTGQIAPCHIEHHKFLVRSQEERAATLQHYERIVPGAGSRFVQFSLPEAFYPYQIQVASREAVVA